MGISHVPFDFGTGDEGGDGIDDDDIDGVGADEGFADFESLFTGIRLADEEVFEADAQVARVGGVHGVLDIDVGGGAAGLLGFGHDVLCERALAGGFGAEDFGDPAARDAADAEGNIECEGARGDALRHRGGAFTEADDGARAVLLFDLTEGQFQRPSAIFVSCHVSPAYLLRMRPR